MPELPELELDDLTHVYRLDGAIIPGCTAVLASMGAAPGFNFLTPDELEFYRSRGHAVHKAVELSIRGGLDKRTLDVKEVKPYLRGWEKFCEEKKVEVFRLDGDLFTEIPLHHPSFRYGVTPDVAGSADLGDGKRQSGVIEIKATSAHAPATGLQLAAQLLAVRSKLPKIGTMRVGLRLLTEHPFYDMRPYSERSDEAVFLSLLNGFNWRSKHKLL